MRKFVVALLALLVLVFPAFAQDDMGTIADIVVSSAGADEAEFTVLLAAVQAADPGILEALADAEGELTVFAPTDAAFTALLEDLGVTAEDLLADTDTLNTVLQYHVVPGIFPAADVVSVAAENGGFFYAPTLVEGDDVLVRVDTSAMHGDMDDMMEEDAMATEEAMEEDDDMMEEDMMSGPVVMVDGATVVTPDVVASNGVVHVIDAVILPDGDPTIADIVIENASMEEGAEFTVLLAAVQAADPAIVEALADSEGALTVFAPTDAAFAAALEALGLTAEELLADTDTLNAVLQYHVLPMVAFSPTVVSLDGESVAALDGNDISIAVTDMGVMLNDSVRVVTTDIYAKNGVIHIIDTVLLPPSGE